MHHRRRTRFVAAALAVALLAPAAARTEEAALGGHGFTLYAGWRFGGGFDDEVSGEPIDVADAEAFSLSLDFALDEAREVQVFYGRQETELEEIGVAPPLADAPLDVEYLHLGGTYFPDGLGRGVYAVGGLGVTRATLDAPGYDAETKLSANVGVGWLVPLGRHVGVRFEARAFGTLLDGDGGLFCTGGCLVVLTGDALVQGELLVGISGRFR